MMTAYELLEAVTGPKLVKLNNKFNVLMQQDPTAKYRLLDLNWKNDSEIESFCKECFGEPKGLHINTLDEQKRLLSRMYHDYHKESGSNYMRMEYTEVGMNEAKQVGVLYHFTTVDTLHKMALKSPILHLKQGINKHISFTRNFKLGSTAGNPVGDEPNRVVRIVLDGNKMSNKYKIQPIRGLIKNDTDVFNPKYRVEPDKYRIGIASSEEEEIIIHPTKIVGDFEIDIKPYIIQIDIMKVKTRRLQDVEVKSALSAVHIPFYIVDTFQKIIK